MLDDKSLREVARLQNNFEMLVEREEYAKALPVIQELTDRVRRFAGVDTNSHDTCRGNLAGTLFRLGRFQDAIPVHWEVIRSREQKMLDDDHELENNLDFVSQCYLQQGDFVSAEPVVRKLLVIREKRGDAIGELNNLAVCLRELGRNDEAESLYLKAVKLSKAKASRNPGSYAHSLNNYALFLKRSARYKKAVKFYLRAVKILAKAKVKRRLLLQTLANLANAYDELGNEAATKKMYDILFRLLDKRPGADLDIRALAINNQAQEDLNRGNHQAAKNKLQEAVAIVKQEHGDKHPRYATAVSNLGVFYKNIGDLDRAEQEFQLALDIRIPILGDSSAEVAQSFNNLGTVARDRGDAPRAVRLLQDSLAVKRRLFKGPHPSVATSMNNVGSMLMSLERWDEAEAMLLDTLKELEQSVGSRSSDYAQTLQNLGDLHKRQGQYEKAESYLVRAREMLLGKYGSGENLALATINLAELYSVTNRPDKALATMNEVSALDQATVSRVFTVASERQRMAFLDDIQTRDHVHWSLVLWKFKDSAKAAHDVFSWVLKRKALGAEALAGQRDGILGGRHPSLKGCLEELTSLRREIAKAALTGPASGDHASHAKHLAQLESRREGMEAELSGSLPEIELARRLEDANPEGVAQKLPANTVLVEFLRLRVRAFESVVTRRERTWNPDRYIAFVLAAWKPDVVRLIDLGDADAIDNLVIAYRTLASVPPASRSARLDDASKRLRKAVFDPIVPHLGGTQKLILSPDGELNMLPFEALALDDGRLVMEGYLISYLASGRDSLRFGLPPFGKAGESVVVADPSYNLTAPNTSEPERAMRSSRDLDRALRFGRLRYTQEEGEKIAALLGTTPWLGDDALESRVKQARSPRVLHLATHGFVLPDQAAKPPSDPATPIGEQRLTGTGMENPLLRSGLALAGANIWLRGGPVPAEAEDGLLTAEDVTGMDLMDTELVVLSACETGLGKVHVGEGVFGLRRAFVTAGARRLVMSLWKVPDRHTQELMVEFYKRVVAGDGGAEALRGAKLAMKALYPDTYYWAAFIFQGDPSPFQVKSGSD